MMPSGILALLKGGKGAAPKGPPEDSEAGGDDMGSPGEMAAEDFKAASDSGDAAGMYSAFERMFKACEAGKHTEVDETEDDEEPGY